MADLPMHYAPLSPAELARYFARIGFAGEPKPDLATLQQLHYLHPLAISFENLDPWLGRCPLLDEAAILAKLVDGGRGGYCFEHNQLFLRVLATLGYVVSGLAARVIVADARLARTHMALQVGCEGRAWLVDVGFGGLTMTGPLDLGLGSEQPGSHEPWRLEQHPAAFLLSACVLGEWRPQYCFSLEVQTPGDYLMANWYVATWPESRFRHELIAARPDRVGRHALLNRRYVRHFPDQPSQETQLASARELHELLQDVFRINTAALIGVEQQLDARLFSPGPA